MLPLAVRISESSGEKDTSFILFCRVLKVFMSPLVSHRSTLQSLPPVTRYVLFDAHPIALSEP